MAWKIPEENMGTRISYKQLDQAATRFASWLQWQGLRPGDRVALMLPNILQYPVALFGALRAIGEITADALQ